MSKEVTIIFPNQLFKNNPATTKGRKIYLVEEWFYFTQYNFHKQKLVLHRASMKFYENWLKQEGFDVDYIERGSPEHNTSELIAKLAKSKITDIHIVDVIDNLLMKKIKQACKQFEIALHIADNPNFINTIKGTEDYFNKKNKYFQTDFYTWQRKQRNILLESDGKPTGGKWTFDAENRAKFPKKEKAPVIALPKENKYITEAKQYVTNNFNENYGLISKDCLFVVTFDDAEEWLDNFLQNRFEKFGIYEDAIVVKEVVLHHSVLSPMLNIGLLQPMQIIEKAIAYSTKNEIPLNSLEGFVRQIMGWREFIRLVYEREGTKQRTTNYWKFTRKIPKSFWTGETGIAPIDSTIKKILETGYCHHIERLMVLGNFMILCEFDPVEVHRWFMEMFIDAYDWVMVPNVYGMTQFADGGLMTTKPYISGSNYLMKMSDYEKGDWQATWDGLFWRFMHEHRSFFLQNPRLGMLVHMFDKMPNEKQQNHLNIGGLFLDGLDTQNK